MHNSISKWYDQYEKDVIALSDAMWAKPESAMEEFFACEQVAKFMKDHGFEVTTLNAEGNEGEPDNTVVARWGSGKPVIGILGELDALNGLGNEAVPYQAPIPGPGQGCGHNLMGAGCGAAAAALKQVMTDENLSGTIIYYGCPAEETLAGKVFMAALGLFNELDVALAWHPSDANGPSEKSNAANTNCYIEFFGKTAHAAGNPDKGRSALDAAELTNVGVQYLREHIADNMRVHYSYIAAGEKPNIVPDYAKLHYFMRGKNRGETDMVVERVRKIAEGAALMTETEMKFTINVGCYDVFLNHTLNRAMYDSILKIPQIAYTDEEYDFAKTMYKNAMGKDPTGPVLPETVDEPKGVQDFSFGSTDVGDVSYICPTVQYFGLGRVKGTPGHHWTVTSCSGMSIGHKGEIFAGKSLAQCGYDLLMNPSIIEEAKKEFNDTKAKENIPPYKPVLPEKYLKDWK